ncbi:hypothetical protein BS17DRAFT_822724, partial [Gyrodon lividus]
TGGQEYNSPHHRQQPQGGFDTNTVLSHADDVVEEDRGMISQALEHVHKNPQQHQDQIDEGDLSKYGPMIFSALSSATSKSGIDIGTLVSGGLGEGGGNELMGLVMKQAGKSFNGGGGEDKQSMMNGAAMTLAKLVAQKQLSSFVGGSNSGGLGMLEIGETLLKSRFG